MSYRHRPYDESDRRPSYNKAYHKDHRDYRDDRGDYRGDYRDYRDRHPGPPRAVLSDSEIRARRELERPSRTLFIRNIAFETADSELREIFEKYGEIKKLFSLIHNRGMAFITFIDIHYSLPKEEGDRAPDDDENTGTLFVVLKDPQTPVTNQDFRKHFSQWGDVREVRDCRSAKIAKFVEYWDLRHTATALTQAQGTTLCGGKIECRYAYDTPRKPDRDMKHHDRDYRDRDYDRRGYGRYEGEYYDDRYAPPPPPPPPPPAPIPPQQPLGTAAAAAPLLNLLMAVPQLDPANVAQQPAPAATATAAAAPPNTIDPNAAALAQMAQLTSLLGGQAQPAAGVQPCLQIPPNTQPNPAAALAGLAAVLQLAVQQQQQQQQQPPQQPPAASPFYPRR